MSSSSDQALVQAITFARAQHRSRSLWISRETTDPDTGQTVTMDDLSWIPDKWWYLVTGQKRRQKVPEKIDRHQFEVCPFSELVSELKCADMCIVDSEDFSDPTDQLVSMEELWKKLPKYAEVVGLPVDTAGFIAHIKKYLNTQAQKHEAAYADNKEFCIKPNGDLWLARLKAKETVPGVDELAELIKSRMPQRNILDIIVDTQKTLNWSKSFGPISGFESKIKDPSMPYAVTTLCYGSHLGPMQTERSLLKNTLWLLENCCEKV